MFLFRNTCINTFGASSKKFLKLIQISRVALIYRMLDGIYAWPYRRQELWFLCVSRTTRWHVATIQSCHWDINPPGTEAAQKCKVQKQSAMWLSVFRNGPHTEEAALTDPFAADRWTARTSADTMMFYFRPALNILRAEAGLSFKGRTTRKRAWHAHKA